MTETLYELAEKVEGLERGKDQATKLTASLQELLEAELSGRLLASPPTVPPPQPINTGARPSPRKEPAMSIECAECERDLRGGHDPSCSRYRPAPKEPAMTMPEAEMPERIIIIGDTPYTRSDLVADAVKALEEARRDMRNAWGAVTSNQVDDKDVAGGLRAAMERIDAALTRIKEK